MTVDSVAVGWSVADLRGLAARASTVVLFALMLAGCRDDAGMNESPDSAGTPPQVGQGADLGSSIATEYAPELNVDIAAMERLPSGLHRLDLEVGDGRFATPGDIIAVHYTGWLPNGQQFDSSRERPPFLLRLGVGDVIEGWDEGVAGMREGGRRRLVIPPVLAYGEAGMPPAIPPNATLVFEIELVELR